MKLRIVLICLVFMIKIIDIQSHHINLVWKPTFYDSYNNGKGYAKSTKQEEQRLQGASISSMKSRDEDKFNFYDVMNYFNTVSSNFFPSLTIDLTQDAVIKEFKYIAAYDNNPEKIAFCLSNNKDADYYFSIAKNKGQTIFFVEYVAKDYHKNPKSPCYNINLWPTDKNTKRYESIDNDNQGLKTFDEIMNIVNAYHQKHANDYVYFGHNDNTTFISELFEYINMAGKKNSMYNDNKILKFIEDYQKQVEQDEDRSYKREAKATYQQNLTPLPTESVSNVKVKDKSVNDDVAGLDDYKAMINAQKLKNEKKSQVKKEVKPEKGWFQSIVDACTIRGDCDEKKKKKKFLRKHK